MDEAKNGYSEAMKKLSEGNGNLINRVENLKKWEQKLKNRFLKVSFKELQKMNNISKPVAASKITLSELMLPSHTNFSGKIHGGYLLSLLDQIAFACASKYSGYYCVTASVDTVDF